MTYDYVAVCRAAAHQWIDHDGFAHLADTLSALRQVMRGCNRKWLGGFKCGAPSIIQNTVDLCYKCAEKRDALVKDLTSPSPSGGAA